MSTLRSAVVVLLSGAALALSGCGGDGNNGDRAPESSDGPTAQVPDTPQESGDDDSSALGSRQGIVTVDGTTWEFEMSTVCNAVFGSVTFVGENEDRSVGVAGGFAEAESDSGFEVKIIGGTTWDLAPGSDFSIDDRTVSGSGEFRDADQPGRTAPGTFQITC